jgi:two-component system LytT family sensor kinase
MKLKTTFFLIVAFCTCFSSLGQDRSVHKQSFTLKGKVIEETSANPIFRVNVEIEGGDYTTTSIGGSFAINAKLGDELVVRSDNFKTVYYSIKSKDFVIVRVGRPNAVKPITSSKFSSQDIFIAFLDSAKSVLKKDAEKSIEFSTTALESSPGKTPTLLQKSMAFETLGDAYSYWDMPDLAVENYKRSIVNQYSTNLDIKLASAYVKNKNYQEAISLFIKLSGKELKGIQKLYVYEGLGDAFKATGGTKKSILNYEKAIDIATRQEMREYITTLTVKIGDAYSREGNKKAAETYYDSSIDLSKNESPKRVAEVKNTAADFYNSNGDFEKEIELREQTLEEINTRPNEEHISSPLTPQRQNYKIANAFIGQEKYKEAIPYLEKSIKEADENEDLYVEKDARRKLSEVYRDIGKFDKAAEGYERYVEVVDELYIKKEQEISQAARLAMIIAAKQNRIAGLENERELNESRYKLAFENQELIEQNNGIQKWIIGSLILIALLLLFTAYSQFKNVKQQKRANNLLALKSLRTQMNPHFIFNALNSVNSFIASNDERAANKYLSEFSQLMRSVLENSDEDFIPLTKEVALLEIYTKLEHSRFKDKFSYEINVDKGIALNEFVIPPMLLQPYVENAVWHGLRYKETKGLLIIDFKKIDSSIVKITIEDNGIGRKKSTELKTENQKKQKSKGMGNIKKRISILNEMYKDKIDVIVSDALENEEGTRVILMIKKD